MKIKFGSIVVDARNKIGGHVASKNRFGAYIRTKVTPTNPRTGAQLTARNRLASLSSGWRNLTQAQRDQWNDAAKLYQKTDIFGDLKTNTGLQLYVGINSNLMLFGGSPIDVPPQPTQAAISVVTGLTADSTPQALQLLLNGNVPDTSYMVVKATPPLSPGKNFVESELRVIGTYAPSATTPISLLSDYQAKFGNLSPAGNKVFVEVYFIDEETGIPSQRQKVSAIIQ